MERRVNVENSNMGNGDSIISNVRNTNNFMDKIKETKIQKEFRMDMNELLRTPVDQLHCFETKNEYKDYPCDCGANNNDWGKTCWRYQALLIKEKYPSFLLKKSGEKEKEEIVSECCGSLYDDDHGYCHECREMCGGVTLSEYQDGEGFIPPNPAGKVDVNKILK